MIEVIAIDDVSLSAHGDYHETLFHYQGEAATQAAERLTARIAELAPRFEPDAVAVRKGAGQAVAQLQTHGQVPAEVLAALVAACPPAAACVCTCACHAARLRHAAGAGRRLRSLRCSRACLFSGHCCFRIKEY
jgi:hypothetical protein